MSPWLLAALCVSAAPKLPYLALPPWIEDRLVYYRTFDAADGKPEVDTLHAQEIRAPGLAGDGFVGRCGVTGGPSHAILRLKSPGFSPDDPLSVSFWWSLPGGCPPNSGYGLLSLSGRGYISLFGRGGPWCGLTDVAAVLQIWSVDGVRNVNDVYDTRIRSTLDLSPGIWHHSALTVASGSLVSVYTDGVLVTRVPLEGRPLAPRDELATLELGAESGDGTRLDEVLVLQRTLTDAEVSDYVTGVRMLKAVGFLR
jgi:hypothetical protein